MILTTKLTAHKPFGSLRMTCFDRLTMTWFDKLTMTLIALTLAVATSAQTSADLRYNRSFAGAGYSDTTAANAGGAAKAFGYLVTYSGGIKLWLRNSTNTQWFQIGAGGGSSDGNNYSNSLGFSGGTLTIGRTGLSALTVSLDGRWNKLSDTATMLSPYARTAVIAAALALKLNLSDTAAMLSVYARVAAVNAALALKLNIADTAAMLAPYARTGSVNAALALKLNMSDTATMLAPYARTATVNAALALKLNIADTTLLLPGNHIAIAVSGTSATVAFDSTAAAANDYIHSQAYNDARYAALAHTHLFSSLTSKPTTLSGYGITDAFPLAGGSITGTAGAGFVGFIPQSSNPSAPSSGFKLFASSPGAFAWITNASYVRELRVRAQTQSNIYYLQDKSYTFADSLAGVLSFDKNASRDSIILTLKDGSRWAAKDSVGSGGGGSGVVRIGTIDSLTKSANGAVISGTNLLMQTADATYPGLWSTGSQTLPGDKQMTGKITLGATSGLNVDKIYFYTDGTNKAGVAMANGAPYIQNFANSAWGWSWNGGNTVQAVGTNEYMKLTSSQFTVNVPTSLLSLPFFAQTTTASGAKQYYIDGTATNRYGMGIANAAPFIQNFAKTGFASWSWNTGGDLQASGTGELMRLTEGGLAINNTSPNASAILDVANSAKGILIPRMTTALRGAIGSPAAGLLVYDTDLKRVMWYDGSVWMGNARAETGTAAPTITPLRIADTFTDYTNKKYYVATGTGSSSDWTITN